VASTNYEQHYLILSEMSLRKRNVNFKKEDEGGGASDSPSAYTKRGSKEKQQKEAPTLAAAPLNATSRIDRLLQSYVQFTSSAFAHDKILKTVQYSLWMLSRFYRSTARDSLVKLSGEVGWARYVNRLLGLPAAAEASRSGSWGSPKALGKAMAWTMLVYYPLEHLAYLKWQTPKWIAPSQKNHRLAANASAWSCRFWFAYIVLDLVRSGVALKNAPETRRTERLQIVRNLLFSLPSIHWSLPNWDTDPWLSDETSNGLMWLESIVCMYQAISNFQEP
jgi:hypothetical protein